MKINSEKNKYSTARLSAFAVTFLIAFPFFFFCFFAFPVSDDYCFGNAFNDQGLWKSQYNWYTGWTGRYSSTFIITLVSSFLSNLTAFQLFLFLNLSFFLTAIFFFTKVFLNRLIQLELANSTLLVISLCFFCLYIYGLPNVTQAFYWLAGSGTYMTGLSVMLFCFVFYVSYLNNAKWNASPYIFLVPIFSIFLCGFNELVTVLATFLSGMLVAVSIFSMKKSKHVVVIFLSIITGFSLMVFAPGNSVRKSSFVSDISLLNTLTNTFQSILKHISFWVIETPIIWVTLLYVLFLLTIDRKKLKKIRLKFNVLWIWLIWLLSISLLILLGQVTTGGGLPLRAENIIYFVYHLFWFVAVSITVVKFLIREQSFGQTLIFDTRFSVVSLFLTLGVFLFLYRPNNNIRTAYADLMKARVFAYSTEMKGRIDAIKNCKDKTAVCVIPALKITPKTIYDVSLDLESESHYRNKCISTYLNAGKVTLNGKVEHIDREQEESLYYIQW